MIVPDMRHRHQQGRPRSEEESDTGVCGQALSLGLEDRCESWLRKDRVGGWRAVSAAGLQGQGSRRRNVFSQTPAVAKARQSRDGQRTYVFSDILYVYDIYIYIYIVVCI